MAAGDVGGQAFALGPVDAVAMDVGGGWQGRVFVLTYHPEDACTSCPFPASLPVSAD